MIRNITLGQYLPGKSAMHRADPRTKIIITMLFMIVLFIIDSIWALLGALVFVAAAYWISKIRRTSNGFYRIGCAIIEGSSSGGVPRFFAIPYF